MTNPFVSIESINSSVLPPFDSRAFMHMEFEKISSKLSCFSIEKKKKNSLREMNTTVLLRQLAG